MTPHPTPTRRWPAEWERQAACLLAWPTAATDWSANLAAVQRIYIDIIGTIVRFQPVMLLIQPPTDTAAISAALADATHRPSTYPVYLLRLDYDDTWCRDFGPVGLLRGGRTELLDFRFNGWGGKYTADRDDAVNRQLVQSPPLGEYALRSIDFELEGGALETDGCGSLLTTWQCLHRRHPALSRETLEKRLMHYLPVSRVLWLYHGLLDGDDTDGHIDTLARFVRPDTIAYQACDDASDPHFEPLQKMAAELTRLRTEDGQAYRLCPLPMPKARYASNGQRLPAGYANFLFVNGALLVPAYDDPADRIARERLSACLPEREVISLPCRELIEQRGALHCIAMHIPAGDPTDDPQ